MTNHELRTKSETELLQYQGVVKPHIKEIEKTQNRIKNGINICKQLSYLYEYVR